MSGRRGRWWFASLLALAVTFTALMTLVSIRYDEPINPAPQWLLWCVIASGGMIPGAIVGTVARWND